MTIDPETIISPTDSHPLTPGSEITPTDIISETARLSAALETFCSLLRGKTTNLASAYQTYEALWNHYILLLKLFDDYRWKSRVRGGAGRDNGMEREVEKGFEELLPLVKRAKTALNGKMKDAVQILAVVESSANTSATLVKDLPAETPRSARAKVSAASFFRLGMAPRRKPTENTATTTEST